MSELGDAFLNARVQFWICPIEAHHHDYPERAREIVRWIDGIAHCMEPGCGRTSESSADSPHQEGQQQ